MFGDNVLFGHKEVAQDQKNRIVIPIETGREPEEELVLLYNQNLGVHEIYSKKTIEEKQEQLLFKMINAKEKKERIEIEKELYEFWKSILRIEKLNKQGRMHLGNIFDGQDKILTIGAYDHLIIESINKEK